MRVLVAPDSFGDTLTAVQAADAVARGWSRARPADEVVCAPLSDGGPGFVDVLSERAGTAVTTTVRGPLGDPTDARWLLDDADGTATAYIECAAACGLHLVGTPDPRTALAASTWGVGELVAAALASGARRIVVGLGGSSSTDGGAGMVAALAGHPSPAADEDPAAVSGADPADLVRAARERLAGVEVVVASDVESPLLGASGAAVVFGPQKGADEATVRLLDDRLAAWDRSLSAATGRSWAAEAGAGAAGGLGAGLLALGGRRVSGAEVVADAIGLDGLVAGADLLITGEGRVDEQTLRGKVAAAVARMAVLHDVPTIVVAGQVRLDAAALREAGIVAAHAVVDIATSVEHAMAQAGPLVTELTAGVAASWRHPTR
ncbi:glycerate kinase family protein [Williamsia deligens]|uniref:Glycerate kinase n=1 Tax=Williamsia deligens TaxID=321325 RepID=A0ABW3G8Y6_9NOCA|nr:glycerate kinase [Williamsia deligens]MCP2195817.1 glycerate kinase [Williamsia deligens]